MQLVVREGDAGAAGLSAVRSVAELERALPGVTARLRDWLKNYKTSDGKPPNTLRAEEPGSREEALAVIDQVMMMMTL